MLKKMNVVLIEKKSNAFTMKLLKMVRSQRICVFYKKMILQQWNC